MNVLCFIHNCQIWKPPKCSSVSSVTQSCLTLCNPMDCWLPCPSLSPGVCLNSCPFSGWCHPTISSSVACFFSCPQSFPSLGSFTMSLLFASGGQKYWSFSFSISPSNEYSVLISFRIDWSPCSPRNSQESSPTPQFKSISSSVFSFLYGPTLTSIHDYW